MRVFLVIIDGLGDLLPSPLEKARTPNMDTLAKEGITGMLAPIGRFLTPGSDVSHLAIFGYPHEKFYPGRGPLEALGAGVELKEGDIAFRGNLSTLENGRIIDRRAGRIESKDARRLASKLTTKIEDVEIITKHTVEHRLAVVLRGRSLSEKVSENDPHALKRPLMFRPLSKNSQKTARILNEFEKYVKKTLKNHPINKMRKEKGLLPANYLLLRGAGKYRKVPSIKERYGISACVIAGGALYKGVARYLGFEVINVKGATGDKNTDVKAKFKKAAQCKHDLIFIHIKACDSAGHDGDFKVKKEMLEKIDEAISYIMGKGPIIITGDHSTPVKLKRHSAHEVPIVISEGMRKDDVKNFSEKSCMKGGLGHIEGKHIMPIILELLGKNKKIGS